MTAPRRRPAAATAITAADMSAATCTKRGDKVPGRIRRRSTGRCRGPHSQMPTANQHRAVVIDVGP